jgi:peptidoglycan/LPS O-acetylase OafA/YrhL
LSAIARALSPKCAARQQRGEIEFTAINRVHYPVALACLLLLPLVGGYMIRRPETRKLGELAAVCLLALLANAFVCGTLSNPHDRYGARLIWLAVTAVTVAVVRLYEERRRLRAATLALSPP